MKKVKSNTRHSVTTEEHLARNMNIGFEKAKHRMGEKQRNVYKLQ